MVVSNDEPWAKRAKQALFEIGRDPIVEANFQQTKDLTRAIGDAMAVSAAKKTRTDSEIIGRGVGIFAESAEGLGGCRCIY